MANDNTGSGFFSKNNDLRNRILFTVLILSIYRLGTYVPLPGINPESLTILKNCKAEPSLKNAEVRSHYQFLRTGYFCADKDSTEENPVFNKTVGLRDSWAKKQK